MGQREDDKKGNSERYDKFSNMDRGIRFGGQREKEMSKRT